MNQENAGRRKKVLFIVTKSNWGGAQQYVFDLATGLPKDRYEPVVVAGAAQGTGGAGELLSRLADAGIRTIFIPEMQRDVSVVDFSIFRALYRTMRRERPDIVHLNSSKAGGIGALAARLSHVSRIVFTVHGWAFREPRNYFSKLLIYTASLLTAVLCHRVICISEFDRRVFSGWPHVGNKMRLVRNGYRETGAVLDRAVARAQIANGHEDAIWVGSNSELNHNKNIRAALDALALALKSEPRLFYVVMGGGEQLERLKTYAERKGLSHRVLFTGYVPAAARLMRAFDIFLLPSRKEGLPYVLLEAAAADVPIVASAVGGIPELIDNGMSGALCEPGDIMGIADSIVELAVDPSLRARFADALKKKTGSEYGFERMVSETVAVYR